MIKRTALTILACLLALSTGAFADEGKDESGKGKQQQKQSKQGKQNEGNASYFH